MVTRDKRDESELDPFLKELLSWLEKDTCKKETDV